MQRKFPLNPTHYLMATLLPRLLRRSEAKMVMAVRMVCECKHSTRDVTCVLPVVGVLEDYAYSSSLFNSP